MPLVQSPQGRQDARRVAHDPPSPALRATQRPLLAFHAVPPRPAQRAVADVPLPRRPAALSAKPSSAGSPAGTGPPDSAMRVVEPHMPQPSLPDPVRAILERLWSAGFEAYVVGGSLRDLLLGRDVADWDVATSALPDQIQALFPESVYENRFGTVAVRFEGTAYEVTTFRRDHRYADHRRPERVEFGATIDEDLSRRDFTMNAI